jgi:hypothetical protein
LTRLANDVCTGAVVPNDAIYSNVPAFPSSFSNIACEVSGSERGVWFQFQPPNSKITRAVVSNQEFDARISLYSGSCASLTCVGEDGTFRFLDVYVTFAAYDTTTYYALVTGRDFDEAGTFKISFEVRIAETI